MKALPATCLVLLLLLLQLSRLDTVLAQSTYRWEVVAHPDTSGNGLESLTFADTLHGWAAWGASDMYRTRDGGFTWQAIHTPYGFIVYQMVMSDPLTLWCFGNDNSAGRIMMTSDGGNTWSQKRDVLGELIRGGAVLSDSIVLASGYGTSNPRLYISDTSIVLRSTDGGSSWRRIVLDAPCHTYRMQFVDSLHGFCEGSDSTLYTSSDGGVSWQRRKLPAGRLQIFFLNSRLGWGADLGRFFRTTDGGATWQKTYDQPTIPGVDPIGVERLSFTDSLYGWAFGGIYYQGISSEATFRTTDGGFTWQMESEGLTGDFGGLTDATMLDHTHGWGVSEDGSVLSYRPGAVDINNPPKPLTASTIVLFEQNYPNPFNGQTRITYILPERSMVSIEILDLLGRTVQLLPQGQQEAGTYRVNLQLSGLASGPYFCRLITPRSTHSRKMLLMR